MKPRPRPQFIKGERLRIRPAGDGGDIDAIAYSGLFCVFDHWSTAPGRLANFVCVRLGHANGPKVFFRPADLELGSTE
jgi:hypothetical protein